MENTSISPVNICRLNTLVYTHIFNNNFLRTPKDNGTSVRNVIGYYNGKLLEARWNYGSDRICFAFISTTENHVDYTLEIPKLKDYIDNMNVKSGNKVTAESFISGNWLIVDFKFNN